LVNRISTSPPRKDFGAVYSNRPDGESVTEIRSAAGSFSGVSRLSS